MASFLRTLYCTSLHLFSMKPPSSPSRLKTLFLIFIFPRLRGIARPVAKAKSRLLELLRAVHFLEFPHMKKHKKQRFFGSFRLHYNWCSSHVIPLGPESYSSPHVYYDSSWNSVVPTKFWDHDQVQEPDDGDHQLSRYLQWLEEKGNNHQESSLINEIDELADVFIANFHEKFRLEKQESYRRFQEMMTRSV